jgi:hypothetical protein
MAGTASPPRHCAPSDARGARGTSLRFYTASKTRKEREMKTRTREERGGAGRRTQAAAAPRVGRGEGCGGRAHRYGAAESAANGFPRRPGFSMPKGAPALSPPLRARACAMPGGGAEACPRLPRDAPPTAPHSTLPHSRRKGPREERSEAKRNKDEETDTGKREKSNIRGQRRGSARGCRSASTKSREEQSRGCRGKGEGGRGKERMRRANAVAPVARTVRPPFVAGLTGGRPRRLTERRPWQAH